MFKGHVIATVTQAFDEDTNLDGFNIDQPKPLSIGSSLRRLPITPTDKPRLNGDQIVCEVIAPQEWWDQILEEDILFVEEV